MFYDRTLGGSRQKSSVRRDTQVKFDNRLFPQYSQACFICSTYCASYFLSIDHVLWLRDMDWAYGTFETTALYHKKSRIRKC